MKVNILGYGVLFPDGSSTKPGLLLTKEEAQEVAGSVGEVVGIADVRVIQTSDEPCPLPGHGREPRLSP